LQVQDSVLRFFAFARAHENISKHDKEASMGIKLDWQVQGRHRESGRQYGEDPQNRRERWRSFRRFFVLVLAFVALLAVGAWLVVQRIEQVNQRDVQRLIETAQAEVALLRIGDFNAFMRLQESATDAWKNAQADAFRAYQERKQTRDLILSGRVVSAEVSGRRGRVQVEEIEDGVPYVQTWFYWRYDADTSDENNPKPAGWYHVPPDYTFWGEPTAIARPRYAVRFASLDAPYANALVARMDAWLDEACARLSCAVLPYLTLDIVSNPQQRMAWLDARAGQLLLPSPYTSRARLDAPFGTEAQIALATLIATEWANALVPSPPSGSDADYFRVAVASWLVGRFAQVDAQAYLIESLLNAYGDDVLARAVATFASGREMDALADVLGVASLASAPLDWRDFLRWRLQAEADAVLRRDEGAFVRLYDTADEATRIRAYERFNAVRAYPDVQVLSVTAQTRPDNRRGLLAVIRLQQAGVVWEESAAFVWVGNALKRAD
jgi:hypothetical protein